MFKWKILWRISCIIIPNTIEYAVVTTRYYIQEHEHHDSLGGVTIIYVVDSLKVREIDSLGQ